MKIYRKGHLYHADGSLYMGRYSLFETKYFSCRVHHIATADLDRVLHDHPWPFISIVLKGGYTELRPASIAPCWDKGAETTYAVRRERGSIAFRGADSRHRISDVDPDTWTAFVYFKWRQDWGFYTQRGKIFWRDYLDSGQSSFCKNNNSSEQQTGGGTPL